jgi:hypothetical protein
MSRQGKVRLAKWYSTYSQKERTRVIKEVTPMVLQRPLKLCNFLDWKNIKLVGAPPPLPLPRAPTLAAAAVPLLAVAETCTARLMATQAGRTSAQPGCQ